MKKLIIIAALLLTFSACKKDDTEPPQPTTAILNITKYPVDSYKLEINGTFRQFIKEFKTEIEVPPGNYSIRFEQFTGYIIWPDVQERQVSVTAGEIKDLFIVN
jgi:hypothetical protein